MKITSENEADKDTITQKPLTLPYIVKNNKGKPREGMLSQLEGKYCLKKRKSEIASTKYFKSLPQAIFHL